MDWNLTRLRLKDSLLPFLHLNWILHPRGLASLSRRPDAPGRHRFPSPFFTVGEELVPGSQISINLAWLSDGLPRLIFTGMIYLIYPFIKGKAPMIKFVITVTL
jgi:hypothetical protein